MFKDSDGNRISAKTMAQLMLAQAVNRTVDSPDLFDQNNTEREEGELKRHLETIGNSILKKLHQPLRE